MKQDSSLLRPSATRIGLLVALVAAFVGLWAAAAAADGEGTVDFDGAGWGHGVGMSQYGAYGRAQEGQTHQQILGAYYQGATIGTLGAATPVPERLFVNVASDITSTTLTVLDGPATPRDGMVITRRTGGAEPTAVLGTGDTVQIVDTTTSQGQPNGCVITLTIDGAATVWEDGTCDLDVALQSGGTPDQLVRATNCRRPNDCTYGYGTRLALVDNGSAQRTTKDTIGGCSIGCPEYPGFDLVVELTLDEYTRGIAEVPYSWPAAALRTQAIAARSYAATYVFGIDHAKAGCFCDVRNDSSYQVYAGWVGDRQSASAWDAAATGTNGQVLVHPASPDSYEDVVRAYYSSSNGGASEWSKEKWGGDYPFLVSVPDSYSLVSANPRRAWTFTESGAEIVDRVWGSGSTLKLVAADVVARNVSGSAKTIRFTGKAPNGALTTAEVPVGNVTSWFGLYSWWFDIDDSMLVIDFSDLGSTVHKDDIVYLASLGIALACDAGPDQFCPGDPMRREDFAAFMVRALDLPSTSTDYFVDDDGLPHEDEINALAAAGITVGCNPPANDRYCPNHTVSRGQTAAFIVRAWGLTDAGAGDWFTDDDGSVYELVIDKLKVAGITRGCNPPANTHYCPDRLLTRGEMSSFLARALRELPTP